MSSPAVPGDPAGGAQRTTWPVLSGILPPLPDAYTPRHETGLGLAGSLNTGETVVLVPGGDVAAALGGAGVSQLAAAIARALWDQEVIDLLVWVTASSRDSVVSSYAQALADVGAPDAGRGPELAATRFLGWLADAEQPWLVVLDDLRDAATIEGLWPSGAAGRVIATSRRPEAAARAPRPRVVEVGAFSRREALAYLTARLHADPDQRLGALDLAADLAFLPIALTQAAAVIAETGIDCRRYRGRLAEHRRLYPSTEGYPWMVAATWSLGAELADQAEPAGLAVPALALVAMLDPNGVPGAALTSPASRAYFGRQQGAMVEPAHVRAVLHNLARVGLLAIDATSAARTVRMHGHVQAIVRHHLPAAERDEAAYAAADALVQVWPQHDGPAGFEQALRDCAAALREVAGKALWSPQCHPVLLRAGRSLDEAGLTGAGIAYWSIMIDSGRRALGPGHPHTVLARGRLAAAYESAGRLPDAIAVYENILADRERALGPGHPETLATCASLARVYRAAGHADEAVRMAERVLAERERAFGPAHPDTLSSRGELAHAYLAADLPNQAVTAFQRNLADREHACGPDHPDTLAVRTDLARAYRACGQFKEAILLHQRNLAEREQAQGADHPDTLAARASLAATYRAAGRLKDAISLHKRTIAGRERAQGTDHLDTIAARADLASAYLAANKVKDAIPLLERALADCERVLGPGHLDTAASRGDLARAYQAVGRLSESIALFEQALADCERALGPDHPLTRAARQDLAAAES